MMALNAKTENDDDFERWNWEGMVALNAENENDEALNAENENNNGSECRNWER